MKRMISILCGIAMTVVLIPVANAQKAAGHGKDYRTFHAGGKIDFGKVGDSYTAELVMYLAIFQQHTLPL